MDLTQLSDAIFRIPLISSGFLQQQEALDENKHTPAPGSPGQFQYDYKRSTKYRLWLRYEGKHSDLVGLNLKALIAESFKQCGIDLAAIIGKAIDMKESLAGRTSGKEEELAKRKKEAEQLTVTIKMLKELQTFLK